MLRRQARGSVERRLDRLERRVEDAEDALAASLSPDQIDELADRVEELGISAPTHDDLLQVRMQIARVTAELTRVRAELQAELDHLTATLLDVTDSRSLRRAAG